LRATSRFFAALSLAAAPAFGQAPAIVPNESLVLVGIPPIPASVAEAVGRYTEYRSASLQSWHPTRREVLISTRFADTAQIHRVSAPGAARTQLTFFPDRVTSASYQPTAGDYFVFFKDVGGGEWYQAYRFDVATGAVTLLTDGKSRNTGAVWSTKGDRIAYSSTRRTGRDNDLWVMNPTDPATDRLLVQLPGGGWGASDWSPDDRGILLVEYVSANESYLWLVDAANGEKRLLTPKGGERVSYGEGEFMPDGASIVVTTDRGSEFQRLVRLDPATGAHVPLTPELGWDVDSFDLSPDGRTIAYVTNEDGADVLHMLDVASGAEKPAPRLPLGTVGGLEWHNNSRELGFTVASARSPSDVYSLDLVTGVVQRWTESETGGLNPQEFSEPELVRWKSFDGRTISGFLYRPPARFAGKRPVIVDIHGGPEGQAQPDFQGRDNYLVSELGVALIFPNVRGSSGYGKTFLQLDNGVLREDSVKDIGALLDWIPTRPDLDPQRVMVTGGSYGGYMTLAAATHYDAKVRCSLSVVGISSFVTFLERTEGYRRDLRRVEYGDERDPAMRAFFEKIAPLANAGKITRPLFVVAGKNDPRVPYTEAEQMVATVKGNGGPVWYLLANDEGHGFAKKKNQDFLFYSTVAFVQEHLLK
jgi:dipeptidyl aminopeptidase/acylaminoacyl peptidase